MDDIDQLLSRLGTRDLHPGLAGMDSVVLARIADARRQGQEFQMKLGAAAAAIALLAGVAGGGASVALAGPPGPMSPLDAGALAPSSLLIPRE